MMVPVEVEYETPSGEVLRKRFSVRVINERSAALSARKEFTRSNPDRAIREILTFDI